MTIFLNNKYKKWYFEIINNPSYDQDGEIHHIIPKSLGGSDDSSNLVKLNYRQHFVCHLLLTRMCVDKQNEIKMCWALHRLTFSKTFYSSKNYDTARRIHIKNLKENHPSIKKTWRDRVSEAVYNSWKENDKRRELLSNKTKERWKNDDGTLRNKSIKNLPSPKFGKENSLTKQIEYKGKIYYGWRELMELTRVSKFLYNKYYLNGIDPEPRIDADGPPSKK